MKKFFRRYPIIRYLVESYVRNLLVSTVVFAVIFLALEAAGLYARFESFLDLKYNSPFVVYPLYGFAILAVLCFIIGFLLYFYKYKRSKAKSSFYKAFSGILKNG